MTEYHGAEANESNNHFQRCSHCESIDLREQEKPPHVGLWCNACGRWVRWIRKSSARLRIAAPPPIPEARQAQLQLPDVDPEAKCGHHHCAEIERLTQALNGIERELTIIVRALCNGIQPR